MIRVYRTLVALSALVFAISLLIALGTLANLDARYLTTTLKVIYLIWPIPQGFGLWFAGKERERGDLGKGSWLLFVQLTIFGGIPAAWFMLMLAAFPS